MDKMLSVRDSVNQGVDVCRKQMDLRIHMIKYVLVGDLYKSILWAEVEKLDDCLQRLLAGDSCEEIFGVDTPRLDLDNVMDLL
jgi:hypothetical protein